MADTYSANLRIRLPQTGAYNNTWGSVLNADAFSLLDDAITGRQQIALSGTTYSLAALADGSDADSRAFCLYFTGAPSGDVTVTIPATVLKKFYLIDNQCGQTITFGYAAGTTAAITTGRRGLIWCDGTNVTSVGGDSLGGVDSTYWARTGRTTAEVDAPTYLSNIFVEGVRNAHPWTTVTEGVTTTIDCRMGNHQVLTLTGNRTMAAPSNASDGQSILLLIIQDGTGGRTLSWNSAFQFAGGASPNLTAIGGNADLFLITYRSATSTWVCVHVGENVGAGGGSAYTLTLDRNEQDVNVFARLGSPGSAVTVTVGISTGVVISASSTATAALDLSGFVAGSTINITNTGYVLGKGGDGGDGATIEYTSAANYHIKNGARDGRNGGYAILCPGSGRTVNITNANGYLWGGGGGGGGGAATQGSANNDAAGGGGGGGGGGSGRGGNGGVVSYTADSGAIGSDGGNGSTGPSGTYGGGGSGATYNSGSGRGASGGNGGDWGTDGTDGGDPTHSTITTRYGAGGTAGKAVEPNGSTVNILSGSSSPHVKGLVT